MSALTTLFALAVVAEAGEARWDVSVHAPLAQVAPVDWTTAEPPTGTLVARDPYQRLAGGLRVARGARAGDWRGLVLGAGIDYWGATWEHEPLDFGAQVWDTNLFVGWRTEERAEPGALEPWVDGGIALHTQLMVPTWYPRVLWVSPGAWLGGGITVGRAAVRPTLALHTGFVVGGAKESGATATTVQDFTWAWGAGRAWVRGELGVAFF